MLQGVDEAYDQALDEFYSEYHRFIDLLMRVAVNQGMVLEKVVKLNAMVAVEGICLHAPYFAKLWTEIIGSEKPEAKKFVSLVYKMELLYEYIELLLLEERASLNVDAIYRFFVLLFPRIYEHVLQEQGDVIWENVMQSVASNRQLLEKTPPSDARQVDKILARINGVSDVTTEICMDVLNGVSFCVSLHSSPGIAAVWCSSPRIAAACDALAPGWLLCVMLEPQDC